MDIFPMLIIAVSTVFIVAGAGTNMRASLVHSLTQPGGMPDWKRLEATSYFLMSAGWFGFAVGFIWSLDMVQVRDPLPATILTILLPALSIGTALGGTFLYRSWRKARRQLAAGT